MNVEDIEAGCLGIEKEGWIDPWAMLCILKKGAMDANAQYVTGELTDFVFRKRSDISVDGVEEGTYEGVDEAIVSSEVFKIIGIHMNNFYRLNCLMVKQSL